MGYRVTFNSPVVLGFAGISGLALFLNQFTNGYTNEVFFSTYPHSSWLNILTYLRLFTHVLGHASLDHYVGNMLMFILLGPMLEEKYGSRKLLYVIAITAVVTAVINNMFFSTGLLGASGVVFACIILCSMTSFKEGEIPLTFIIVLVLYLGREMVNGFTQIDNVSQMGHLIGGVCGAMSGFFFTNRKA